MTDSLARIRALFAEATGLEPPSDAFVFGDSPALADDLAALVIDGTKRATTALLADLAHRDEQVPSAGDLAIVLDGRQQPVAVIRTTDVQVAPLRTVDAAFAWDEGEGDRSLEYWLAEHERFFRGRCDELGLTFSHDLLVVFERFELFWTP